MEALGDHISLLNLVDIIAFVVIALCMFVGSRRGLSGELAGTVSTVAGFILGMMFFAPMVEWLVEHSRLGEGSARMVAFVLVFLVVFAIMLAMRIGLRALLKVAIEKKTDRWGGAMAGFVKALVIVLAVFLLMIMAPGKSLNRTFGEESMIGSLLLKAIPELRNSVAEHIDVDGEVMRLLDGE